MKIPATISLLLTVTLGACSTSKHVAARQETYKVGSTYYTFDAAFVKYFGPNVIPDLLTVLEKSEK